MYDWPASASFHDHVDLLAAAMWIEELCGILNQVSEDLKDGGRVRAGTFAHIARLTDQDESAPDESVGKKIRVRVPILVSKNGSVAANLSHDPDKPDKPDRVCLHDYFTDEQYKEGVREADIDVEIDIDALFAERLFRGQAQPIEAEHPDAGEGS